MVAFKSPEESGWTEKAAAYDQVLRHGTALWMGTSGEQLLALIYKATVRTPMIIAAQVRIARAAIKQEKTALTAAMRADVKIPMRWPYLLRICTACMTARLGCGVMMTRKGKGGPFHGPRNFPG